MAEYKNEIILCASSIILKKNQGLQALPPLRPALQRCSTHILQSVFEDAGGLEHTAVLPAQSSAAHWEPDLLLPCGLPGIPASVEAFCLRKECMPKGATSGKFFSQRLQLLQMLSHNKWTDQVSVTAFPENLSQCSFTHWKSSLWPTGSLSVQNWQLAMNAVGQGLGTRTKTLQRADSVWVTALPLPAWLAPMAGTAGTERIWSEGWYCFLQMWEDINGKVECLFQFFASRRAQGHWDQIWLFRAFKELRNWSAVKRSLPVNLSWQHCLPAKGACVSL